MLKACGCNKYCNGYERLLQLFRKRDMDARQKNHKQKKHYKRNISSQLPSNSNLTVSGESDEGDEGLAPRNYFYTSNVNLTDEDLKDVGLDCSDDGDLSDVDLDCSDDECVEIADINCDFVNDLAMNERMNYQQQQINQQMTDSQCCLKPGNKINDQNNNNNQNNIDQGLPLQRPVRRKKVNKNSIWYRLFWLFY